MSDVERFIRLVEIGAPAYAVSKGRGPHTAIHVIDFAMDIAEEVVPHILEIDISIGTAVVEYLELQYAVFSMTGQNYPIPKWLVGIPPY